jgi:maleylacetoacetate isomerase/maleylpyruvate isomerase
MAQNMSLKLYNYFRSSASYRIRIALHWKHLQFEYVPVHLVKGGGEQHSSQYRILNPMGHVPALIHGDFVIAESMAILDYLEHTNPQRPLFPTDFKLRARVIQICEIINSGIQPYQNLKILKDFESAHGWDQEKREGWVRNWVEKGLAGLEEVLKKNAGTYACGQEITAADAFIVPQVFSSRRFKVDISKYPTLARVAEAAGHLDPFKQAHPGMQPDTEV